MSVCVVFEETIGPGVLPVALRTACHLKKPLLFLHVDTNTSSTETKIEDVSFSEFGDEPFRESLSHELEKIQQDSSVEMTLEDPTCFRIATPEPLETTLAELRRLKPTQLIVAGHRSEGKQITNSTAWEIFESSECDSLFVCQLGKESISCDHILVPVIEETHFGSALKIADHLAFREPSETVALRIEDKTNEIDRDVSARTLNRLLHTVLPDATARRFVQRVEIADDQNEGLRAALHTGFSMLILGLQKGRKNARQLQQTFGVIDSLDSPPTAIAISRSGTRVTGRLSRRFNDLLQISVPQLTREQRISLVEQVQSTSKETFDFNVLMCLSTLIASFGLLLNSGAVIIGAMLVAPMMTPIVGAGLSVTQGNLHLFRTSARSVAKGFVLAFGLSILLGLSVQFFMDSSGWPNSEMLARDSPSLLDLLVAFISGLVASYAMGRPNLTSALPGVAIAAALIPPIATAGMSLAMGNLALMFGALLLFLTNIVAIALATAISLRAIGIRDTHDYGTQRNWSRIAAISLLVAAIGLAVYESMPHPAVPAVLTDKLTDQISKSGGRLEQAIWKNNSEDQNVLRLTIERDSPPPADLVEILQKSANEHYQTPVVIELETRLVLHSTDDSGP